MPPLRGRGCGYSKFHTPSILIQPVYAHRLRLPRRVVVLSLPPPSDAEPFYRHRFSTVEFVPRDINVILANPLSLGTFLAVESHYAASAAMWRGTEAFLADPLASWALLNVWNCKDMFWMEPFVLYFMYGVGKEGAAAAWLLRGLYAHAHNMVWWGGCWAMVEEVEVCEPPQWGSRTSGGCHAPRTSSV
ncbi:hypothetical protein Taro_012302 [Colocasia esculenta]|uniref:Uncharacterized protein n=1 Tax=Colocasia esculenta TaxID=4460 RepID=A0A843UD72_COLES|nr:hypothetical protein [Colocasia esculenta]